MIDYWCFSAVLEGQTLPLETGLEAVLAAEKFLLKKQMLVTALLELGLKMNLTLTSWLPSSAGLRIAGSLLTNRFCVTKEKLAC